MTRHLFERLQEAHEQLAPVQSRYRVVFEDPERPEDCCSILVPDPNWLAAALAGGVLPPIAAYLDDQAKVDHWCACNDPKAFSWDLVGGASHPYADPIGPMSEEEAIEYLIMKDVPRRVWDRPAGANQSFFRICPVEAIPTERTFRNAWRLVA